MKSELRKIIYSKRRGIEYYAQETAEAVQGSAHLDFALRFV